MSHFPAQPTTSLLKSQIWPFVLPAAVSAISSTGGAVGSIAYWSAAALLLGAMLKTILVRDVSGCRSKVGLVYCCSVGWLLAVAASMPAVVRESTGLFPELGMALCWLIVLMIQILVSIKLTEWVECHRAVALAMVFIASGLLAGVVEHRKGEFASYSDGQMLLPLFGFWPGFHRAIEGEVELELPRHDQPPSSQEK